jgi:aerobic carbon-monoxide dehydrogenase medium subunit
MYEFAFKRPATLTLATADLRDDPDARVLAGGQTLLPTMKARLAQPSALVAVTHLADLKGIALRGDLLEIGASTCHADVAASAIVKDFCPGLAALAGGIGDPQVRNRGTLGGSLANNDPSACYPAAVLALNATIHTDRRAIAADDFFKGMFATALEADEIITKVSFPRVVASAYEKFANPASRYAIVGVMAARTADAVRIAVTGAGPCVFRWREAEAALAATFSPECLHALMVSPDGLNSDLHASAAFRAHLVGVMAQRAVQRIVQDI